jgi:hypothetical protein
MKTILKYKKVNKHHYLVQTKSGKVIGEFVEDVDGLFYFFLIEYNGGSFSSELLAELSCKLSKLNYTWNKTVNNYFDEKMTKS